MKIGLMSNNGPPKCARYMDIWQATALRGPSFSTSPIKTCHCWISSECQRKGAEGITRGLMVGKSRGWEGKGHSFIHSYNTYLLNTCYVSGTVYCRLWG